MTSDVKEDKDISSKNDENVSDDIVNNDKDEKTISVKDDGKNASCDNDIEEKVDMITGIILKNKIGASVDIDLHDGAQDTDITETNIDTGIGIANSSGKTSVIDSSDNVSSKEAESAITDTVTDTIKAPVKSDKSILNQNYCVLPLRDMVIFPRMMVPIFMGRGKSIATVEQAMKTGRQIVLVAQRNSAVNSPKAEDLFTIGVKASILQLTRLPDKTIKVLVEAVSKVKIHNLDISKPYWSADVSPIFEEPEDYSDPEIASLVKSIRYSFSRYIRFNKDIFIDNIYGIDKIDSPVLLIDTIVMGVGANIEKKQEILECSTLVEKLRKLYEILETELDFLKTDRKIRNKVRQNIDKSQRDYYLQEQMRAIQKELDGENADEENDYKAYEKKIDKLGLSKEAYIRVKKEIKKLRNMSAQSPEYSVIHNWLDLVFDLPWKRKSNLDVSIKDAEEKLNAAHYGLDKIKERILEFLAVQKKVGKNKGTILCFMGPPGVGKTSLGKAIADSTGRVFEKISLGGLYDEAEIRGHRRTYIGAACGKILSTMKKAGVNNPLIMLDEIDKMSSDFHGDPASAMLEVLDPEQNNAFSDHYLDLDYDLSNVMFIATSNSYNIPRPLLDRMEVIELSGYTEMEKTEIAKSHIIPKNLVKNGLDKNEISISDGAILDIIRYYTKESGVRGLERKIDTIMRKAVKKLMMVNGGEKNDSEASLFELTPEVENGFADNKKDIIKITPENLHDYLGIKRYDFGKMEKNDSIGTVTGLAWTEVGGELLVIESAVMQGVGKSLFTGKLGDVMKESIETAKSFVKSHSNEFGINPEIWDKVDIHIHVPEGATPKDGPSAGLAMMTSVVSTMTNIPVKKDIAMTGEITLRGNALPIGGLKEKLLAALRGGIKTVLIPKDNEKDLEEIPNEVKKGLNIITVSSAMEVLKLALIRPFNPIPTKGDFFENILSKAKEKDEKTDK